MFSCVCRPLYLVHTRAASSHHMLSGFIQCAVALRKLLFCAAQMSAAVDTYSIFSRLFCLFKYTFYSGNHFCRLVLYLLFLPVFCELCLSKGSRLSSWQHIFHNVPYDQSVKFLPADILWSRQAWIKVKPQLLMLLLSNTLVPTLKICNN